MDVRVPWVGASGILGRCSRRSSTSSIHGVVSPAPLVHLCTSQDAPGRPARWASTRATSTPRITRHVALRWARSEEPTSELQSLMRIPYAVLCLKKKKLQATHILHTHTS